MWRLSFIGCADSKLVGNELFEVLVVVFELVGFNNADFVKEVSKVKSRKFTFSADVVGVISRSYYDGKEKVQIEVQCLEFFEPETNDVYKDFASMLSFI